MDLQIESLPQNAGENKETNCGQQSGSSPPSDREMGEVYAKLNNCRNKAVALSLIDPYADQFIDESRTLPTISD